MTLPIAIRARHVPPVAFAILAFALWRSLPLLDAWRHSPLDRFGWVAFALWFLPIVILLLRPLPRDSEPSGMPSLPAARLPTFLLAAGLLATLLGTLGAFNAASYLGLALVGTALALQATPSPGSSCTPWIQPAVWAATALSWMPVLSWLARDLPVPALASLRVVAALGGSFLLLHSALQPARPS